MEDTNAFVCYLLRNPTAVVAAIGTAVALTSLHSQRHLTKAKHTLDFDKDFKEKHRATLVLAQKAFVSRQPRELAELGRQGKLTENGEDAFTAIATAINLWEGAAIGVKSGVYLEDLLWRSYGSTIAILYLNTLPFVSARRAQNPRLFTNFLWLGLRWTRRLVKEGHVPGFPSVSGLNNSPSPEAEQRAKWEQQLSSEGWQRPKLTNL
ncbi:TPA: DUF4760 domain-containing protein [Stenotrophomonas maltophilia]|nr:DUF4760 domain-containing protein [Stenotrophomonas maltophilia]